MNAIKIKSDQLILLGHSGTTSGDGNTISVKYNNIELVEYLLQNKEILLYMM
jgi:hypothetical protein